MKDTKKYLFLSELAGLLFIPLFAFAIDFAAPPAANSITSITSLISSIVTVVWQVFVGFVVILFIIAGMAFFLAEGEPEKLKTARRFVIWGVVGVIVALIGYSIITIVSSNIGLGGGSGYSGDPGGTTITGACCYSGSCVVRTQTFCLSLGSGFSGAGSGSGPPQFYANTACEAVVCRLPSPGG